MTPKELQQEIDARGLGPVKAARVLGVERTTLWRWLNWSRPLRPQAVGAIRWALMQYDQQHGKDQSGDSSA